MPLIQEPDGRIEKSTSRDNSQWYFHVTLLASRDINLLGNNIVSVGTTSNNASPKEENSRWGFIVIKRVGDPAWPQIDLHSLWLTHTRV